MTLDEAGRRKEAWKAKHSDQICKHERMVDYLLSKKGKNTGYLVCLECGEVFIDPMKYAVQDHLRTLDELAAEDS